MTLKFSTGGRPMIECINPECGKLHAIHRRGDYVKRTKVRVQCRGCGTKWNLSQSDGEKLKNHYEQRQQELQEKKLLKIEKEPKKQENVIPDKKEKSSKEPEKTTKKESWLESLLG